MLMNVTRKGRRAALSRRRHQQKKSLDVPLSPASSSLAGTKYAVNKPGAPYCYMLLYPVQAGRAYRSRKETRGTAQVAG
jgi:hypothetical protein